jgi:hypothetical protein
MPMMIVKEGFNWFNQLMLSLNLRPRRKRIDTNRKRSRKNGEKSSLIGGRKQKGAREKFGSKNHREHH